MLSFEGLGVGRGFLKSKKEIFSEALDVLDDFRFRDF